MQGILSADGISPNSEFYIVMQGELTMRSRTMKQARVIIMAGLMMAVVAISACAVNITAKTDTALYQRAKASSGQIATVKEGTSRKVLRSTKYYYKVKLNGKTGYVKKKAVMVEDDYFQKSVAGVTKLEVGKPYQWGAAGPNAFDSSGFCQFIYSRYGKSIPRSTKEQYSAAVKIKRSGLKAGDLVFFRSDGGKTPSYNGVYIGDDQIVLAANAKNGVAQKSLNSSYYATHFLAGGRFDCGGSSE